MSKFNGNSDIWIKPKIEDKIILSCLFFGLYLFVFFLLFKTNLEESNFIETKSMLILFISLLFSIFSSNLLEKNMEKMNKKCLKEKIKFEKKLLKKYNIKIKKDKYNIIYKYILKLMKKNIIVYDKNNFEFNISDKKFFKKIKKINEKE